MGNLFSSSVEQQSPRPAGRINKRQKTGVHLSSMQETMVCAQCEELIEGSYTKAMNKYFHLDCFQCCKCQKPVRTSKFYRIEDQVYCQQDYDRYVNPDIDICAVCLERILDGKAFESQDHCYHERCFRCCNCATQLKPAQEFFTRSSASKKGREVYCKQCRPTTPVSKTTVTTETETLISSSSFSNNAKNKTTDEDKNENTTSSSSNSSSSSSSSARPASSKSGTKSSGSKAGRSSSIKSSSSSSSSKKKSTTTSSSSSDDSSQRQTCAACNKLIEDTVMSALNQSYHPACFVCAKCQQPFLHNKFFVDHNTNNVYCRADFPYKLFPESQAEDFDSEQRVKQQGVAKRKRQGSR